MLAYIIVLQHSHPSYQQCRVSFVPVAIGSHAHRKMTLVSNHRTEIWLVGWTMNLMTMELVRLSGCCCGFETIFKTTLSTHG